ncbi:MAG TPA: hypothetical protein VEA80_18805 [Vitreimonas sp.]|uniref:hypothetical protein n=1 Tax=Vitreimonas sp. TaxID=3069702 RepID=UPI002D28DE98|nr:hypothetical protein [Vitreimonas sp.]HYD89537.1 hypothetical protein [Vitreimonas sp.]
MSEHKLFVRPERAPQVVPKTLKYRDDQEHLLRRLGGALVLQWDELPDALQDLIIDQAAAVDDRDAAPHAAEDIERFIRNVKTMALAKAPDGK